MSRYYNDFSGFSDPDSLEHYGVKGMKWGIRKDDGYHAAKTGWGTKRMAVRDANEFAKAKMYYGEGAGNRRKLIKNQVSQRSKDKFYKQMYDEQLGKQDWAKRAEGAKSQRHRTDAVNTTRKTTRGVIHAMAGNPMYASAAAIAITAGATAVHKTGLDKKAVDSVRKFMWSHSKHTVDDILHGR